MIALTGYTILDYLINRGLFKYEYLDDTEWQCIFIENQFSLARNSNFIVQVGKKSQEPIINYFLKQPVSLYLTDDELQIEEDVLGLLRKFDLLKPYLLEFAAHPDTKSRHIEYDSVNRVLLMKYQESSSFLDVLMGLTKISKRAINTSTKIIVDQQLAVTGKLGKTLALFSNSLQVNNPNDTIKTIQTPSGENVLLPKNFKPWLLDLTKRDIKQLHNSNSPLVEKLGDVLGIPEVIPEIIKLRDEWQFTHLINSDSNLSNVLVMDQKEPEVLLIDWELAGCGPFLWQLAGIVAHFLSFTVFENPPISIPKVQEHLHILFENYFSNMPGAEVEKEKNITYQYAGIKLLQQYYRWASTYLNSGNSADPDMLNLGKDCLLKKQYVLT